jgi:hypothetical protein
VERQTGQDYFLGRGELRVCKHVLLPSKSIGVGYRHRDLPSRCAIWGQQDEPPQFRADRRLQSTDLAFDGLIAQPLPVQGINPALQFGA